jgi:hypothetical protein
MPGRRFAARIPDADGGIPAGWSPLTSIRPIWKGKRRLWELLRTVNRECQISILIAAGARRARADGHGRCGLGAPDPLGIWPVILARMRFGAGTSALTLD